MKQSNQSNNQIRLPTSSQQSNYPPTLQSPSEIGSPFSPTIENINTFQSQNQKQYQPNLAPVLRNNQINYQDSSPNKQIDDQEQVTEDMIGRAQMFEDDIQSLIENERRQRDQSNHMNNIDMHDQMKQNYKEEESYINSQMPVNYIDQDVALLMQQRLTTDEELQKLALDVDFDNNQNSPDIDMDGLIPNYEIEFNFEGFHHQDLIERNLNMQCFLQTYSSKECIVCHPMLQQLYLNALQPERALETPKHVSGKKFELGQIITDNLHRKYMTSKDFYNVKIVNDIIYNEPTHIVAIFKDYLIYDDLSEFLKRFYENGESITRLPKICEFYEKYSKVFPNYVVLPESKMMYKNIERKQKIIDDKQKTLQAKTQMKEEKIKKKMMKLNGGIMPPEAEMAPIDIENYESSMSWFKNSQRFFDTKFMDSVLKQDPLLPSSNTQHSSFLQKSQLLDRSNLKSGNLNISNSQKGRNQMMLKSFAELNLEQLVSAFVSKDQKSNNSMMNQSNVTATLDITMPSFHQQDEAEKFVKAMIQSQQKQKEIIMRQMMIRKENQKLILNNNPKPQLLAQQQLQIGNQASPDQQKPKVGGVQPQTVITQTGQKFIFNTNGVNNIIKQQKQYFEKVKTDSKRRSSQGSSLIQNPSPQTQATLVSSPPKVQNHKQQLFTTKDPPALKHFQSQQQPTQNQPPQLQLKTLEQQKSTQVPNSPKIAQQTPGGFKKEEQIEIKNNNIIKKKVKKQLPSTMTQAVNLNHHQQPEFKIKHGFANVPSNIAFNQFSQTQTGSITQRESLQKKLITNLVINQNNNYQSNFSPLDMHDIASANQQKKQKMFNYNNHETQKNQNNQIIGGSQSARVQPNYENKQINQSKLKQNISLSKDARRAGVGSQLAQNAQNNIMRTSQDQAIINSMKAQSQDRDKNFTQSFGKQKTSKPGVLQRIDDLIRGEAETPILSSNNKSNNHRPQSPQYYFEESKQMDISNTLQNQSQNHMFSYSNQTQQPQLAQKFMNKRNISKQLQQNNQNANNAVQMSSTISHGNSGYNTQQTNTGQTLQQTSNSSNHANQIMKVMSLDIADISTNLNNNSRNFLARQQQQQIQFQKQSRGMNPRQKSVPKNKKQTPQQNNNMIFIGEGNLANLYGSQIQNMNNSSQLQNQYNGSGRQTPSTARNSQNQNQIAFSDVNQIQSPQYLYQQSLIGSGVGMPPPLLSTQNSIIPTTLINSAIATSGNNRYDSINTIIPNNRQIIKKVVQTTKNSQQKSNSQNRARDFSPMDYQVNLLGSTLQQDQQTFNQNSKILKSSIKADRQSLDRPAKLGLPYQQQMNLIVDNRDTSKRYSLKVASNNVINGGNLFNNKVLDNKAQQSIEQQQQQQSSSRTRQNSNPAKKIIIGKKTNIFGNVATSKRGNSNTKNL